MRACRARLGHAQRVRLGAGDGIKTAAGLSEVAHGQYAVVLLFELP